MPEIIPSVVPVKTGIQHMAVSLFNSLFASAVAHLEWKEITGYTLYQTTTNLTTVSS